jgi:acetylglutamate kinase
MDENDENSVIPYLSYYDFPRLVQEGIISGGMIPKIQNAFEALQAGVSSVLITKAEALDKFTGTTIAL